MYEGCADYQPNCGEGEFFTLCYPSNLMIILILNQ